MDDDHTEHTDTQLADHPGCRSASDVAAGRLAEPARHGDHGDRAVGPRRDPRGVHDRQARGCVAGRLRGRPRQRRRLAGIGVPHRSVVSADPRSRRDRAQRVVRHVGVGVAARGRRRRILDVAADRHRAGRPGHWTVGVAGARRRRLVRRTGGTPSQQALARRHRDRRARCRVRSVRRRRPSGPAAGHSIGRRPEPASLAARRQPSPRRVGDRVVVADRCQPSRDPARLDPRHARLPLARQIDRRDRRVEPPQVCSGDRIRPFRRKWAARPPGLELRQPVLGRRGEGRAHDEWCRTSQGRSDRRRLLRLLRAARPDDQDLARVDRGDHTRTGGGHPTAAAAGRATRRAGLDVRAVAHVHDGDHPGRVGARRHERHVGGAGRHLRRHVGLRRGRSPLRSGTRRHAGRVARPRPPARPDRAGGPIDAAARTRSSCSPTTARPRVRRSSSAAARPSPSSSPTCAVRPRPATPTPRPVAPSRPRGSARHVTPTSRRRRWSPTYRSCWGRGVWG